MTEFYLVTGFLGAGKTTFLKNFIKTFQGKQLRLIINEFGKEGVDGRLLEAVHASLQEITGGSVFCSCRLDKFEEALEEGLCQNPDVLIVEASGLSDPTNIRRILEENEKNGRLVYRGCVCLADALRLPRVFSTARVVKKQLIVGDLILLNKTDLATAEEISHARSLITEFCPQAKIRETVFGAFDPAWLSELTPYRREDSAQETPDITLQRASVRVDPSLTPYELERFVSMFAEDTNRVKGFVYLDDTGWLLADCVGPLLRFDPWTGEAPPESLLNILATSGMPMRKSLKHAVSWYTNKIQVIFS